MMPSTQRMTVSQIMLPPSKPVHKNKQSTYSEFSIDKEVQALAKKSQAKAIYEYVRKLEDGLQQVNSSIESEFKRSSELIFTMSSYFNRNQSDRQPKIQIYKYMEELGVIWNLQDLQEIQQDFDAAINEEIFKEIVLRETIKIKLEQEALSKRRGKAVKPYKATQKYQQKPIYKKDKESQNGEVSSMKAITKKESLSEINANDERTPYKKRKTQNLSDSQEQSIQNSEDDEGSEKEGSRSALNLKQNQQSEKLSSYLENGQQENEEKKKNMRILIQRYLTQLKENKPSIFSISLTGPEKQESSKDLANTFQ